MDHDKYRSHLNDEGEKNTIWRFGAPPNYDAVNKLFEEGRTKVSLLYIKRYDNYICMICLITNN